MFEIVCSDFELRLCRVEFSLNCDDDNVPRVLLWKTDEVAEMTRFPTQIKSYQHFSCQQSQSDTEAQAERRPLWKLPVSLTQFLEKNDTNSNPQLLVAVMAYNMREVTPIYSLQQQERKRDAITAGASAFFRSHRSISRSTYSYNHHAKKIISSNYHANTSVISSPH